MLEKLTRVLKKKHKNEKVASPEDVTEFSKYGIGARLAAAFTVVAILTVAISAISWVSLDRLSEAEHKLTQENVPAISLALKLANETSQLSAAAPQLSNAKSDGERNQSFKGIKLVVNKAEERLKNLNEFMAGDAELVKIEESLNRLLPMFERLDDEVKKRLDLAILRGEAGARLNSVRDVLDTEMSALVVPLRMQILNNADRWNELLDDSVSKAQKGNRAEFDTSELSGEGLKILRFQENVFSFKSNGYLMTSLLAEGLQAENINAVKALEEAFLSSIASMSSPLVEIEQERPKEETEKLSKLFDQLLSMGVTGSKQESEAGNSNIFTLRTRELEAVARAKGFVQQSQFLTGALTHTVNEFVDKVESSVVTVAKKNERLSGTTKATLLICAVIAMMIAAAIGWFYIRGNIIRRLMMLVESAQKLSEGDLVSSIYRDGKDEIAQLGHALVGFRDTAREAEATRQEAEEQRQKREEEKAQREEDRRLAEQSAHEEKERLAAEAEADKLKERNQLADDFEGSVKHLVEKFAAATSEMTVMSKSMSEAAEDTSHRSSAVASASDMASSSVNSVAAATEELSSSITEISRQVNQAAGIAGEAVSEAERTNVMVNTLNEAASKIGDVVGLINDIAGQTNLLALNATIEAARAGDAGKGFAVVASEVKNLATQTAKATEEISEQIKSVQEETVNAVGAIGGITTTIGRINEIATTISAAVEEQGAATGEISRSVQQAAEGSQEVSENIISVNEAASSTGQTAAQVKEVSDQLVEEVGNLDREVERFLAQVRAG
jgi:methyl-accepting chemotaxis protein